jgi:hypothetical protein
MLLLREWSTENSSLEVDTEKVEMDKSTNVFVNFGKIPWWTALVNYS